MMAATRNPCPALSRPEPGGGGDLVGCGEEVGGQVRGRAAVCPGQRASRTGLEIYSRIALGDALASDDKVIDRFPV